VALISDTGVLLLRQPFDNGALAPACATASCTATMRSCAATARTGSRFFHSLHDGELRLNSFRPLEHYPLFVTAALSREEMLERWRRDTFTRSIGVVVLAALIGFSASGWWTRSCCASRPRPSCARRATRWKAPTARSSGKPCRTA
jgi:hypothetical protein